jgi:hypothetical protein
VTESLRTGITTPAVLVHAATAYAGVGDLAGARTSLEQAFTGSPWMTPAVIPVAEQLATQLGLALPAGWQR